METIVALVVGRGGMKMVVPKWKVELKYGGYILCHSIKEAKSKKGIVITIGQCDCYKSSCECVTELYLPSTVFSSWKMYSVGCF